jgi:membrane protein YdbS with pleckstrin-like domain
METTTPTNSTPPRGAVENIAAAQAQAPTPETELWAGRTSWRHYIGRITLWLLLNVGAFVLLGWIASREDWLARRGALWTALIVLGASTLIMLLPVFLRIYSRRYRLTSQRLFIEVGILSRTIDQSELIRVDDVRVHKTLFDRIFGLGTVTLISTDVSNREVVIEGVASPDTVAEAVRGHMRAQRGKALFVENL